MEGIDIIYHDTSKILYTLKEPLAIQVAGTWKVWMIQHSIGTNEVKMSFYAHTGATDLFLTVFFFKAYDYWFVGFSIDISSNELVKMDFLQQCGWSISGFGTKEIVKVLCSDIFLKLTDGPVPVSSTRTNQLKLKDHDFDKINELFSRGLF